jgi:hypothetical protein
MSNESKFHSQPVWETMHPLSYLVTLIIIGTLNALARPEVKEPVFPKPL